MGALTGLAEQSRIGGGTLCWVLLTEIPEIAEVLSRGPFLCRIASPRGPSCSPSRGGNGRRGVGLTSGWSLDATGSRMPLMFVSMKLSASVVAQVLS